MGEWCQSTETTTERIGGGKRGKTTVQKDPREAIKMELALVWFWIRQWVILHNLKD
jgi:hypothetical protein